MRTGVAWVLAVVLVGAVGVTAPVGAVDLERIEAMKEAARAATLESRMAAAATKADKAVVVRCDKGESVQAALDKNPGPVTIEIRGICAENVRIERRSDVTLRGRDPVTDGLRGIANPARGAALEVRFADRIWVESLSLSDGVASGIFLTYARVTLGNSRMNGNAGTGLVAAFESQVTGEWLEMSHNSRYGMVVSNDASVYCQSCDLQFNSSWAVLADDGAFVTMWDTVVEGWNGLWARENSYADVDCLYGTATDHECHLFAGNLAFLANWGGSVGFGPGPFEGRISVNDGRFFSFGAQQASLPEGVMNLFSGTSNLATVGSDDSSSVYWTSQLARTNLREFSRAILRVGTEVSSVIECFDAADAVADPSVDTAGNVVNCPHVSTDD